MGVLSGFGPQFDDMSQMGGGGDLSGAMLGGMPYQGNGGQAGAQASMYGSYLDYLARLQGYQNAQQLAQIQQQTSQNVAGIQEQGQETVAGTQAAANEYGTDEQRQQAYLQNQAQNLGTASQNQLGLANVGANQYQTQQNALQQQFGTQVNQQLGMGNLANQAYATGVQNQLGLGGLANQGYATQQQALQNQYATGAQNQAALANVAANQYATGTNLGIAQTQAQQQQLQTDAARYNTAAGIQQAGIGAQSAEQVAATNAAAQELPTLEKAYMGSQLLNSPLVSSILGSSGFGGIGGGGGSSKFGVSTGFDPSAIQGAVNAAQDPRLFQPQQAQYQQSQFAPPSSVGAPTVPGMLRGPGVAGPPTLGGMLQAPGLPGSVGAPGVGATPGLPQGLNPQQFANVPTSFPVPPGSGQLNGVRSPTTSGGWNNPGMMYTPGTSSPASGQLGYTPPSAPTGPMMAPPGGGAMQMSGGGSGEPSAPPSSALNSFTPAQQAALKNAAPMNGTPARLIQPSPRVQSSPSSFAA